MTRAPKILYHGTTFGRYMFGIRREGLRGNMPRTLRCDERHHGYVFLTDSAEEAAQYALVTWFFDRGIPELSPYAATTKCLVLGVKTNKLRKGIIEDPEYHDQKKYFEEQGSWERIKENFGAGVWYMYNGNIPNTAIFVLDMLDIKKQHPFIIETLANYTNVRFMAERGESQELIKKAVERLVDDVPD